MKPTLYSLALKIALLIILFTPFITHAQITSSGMNGVVKNDKGEILPGATVVAVYTPTQSKFGTVADENGYYRIENMTPGGPYQVKVTSIGLAEYDQDNVNLILAEDLHLDFSLVSSTQQLQTVTVTADKLANKTGTATSVSKQEVKSLPTISRNITDFTRLTPQSTNNSFAGTNFRYNNITIDGAINNDAISFSPSLGGQSGTSNMPGSSTRTASISLDAIKDLQVQVAPYDVRLGNFTGGSINAVTRTGTNELTGSVYAFGRNSWITGPNNSGDKSAMPSSFSDFQGGVRLGFPIVKNKLFFFTNEEYAHQQVPVFFGAGSQGSVLSVAEAQQITDSLNSSTFLPKTQFNPNGTFNVGAFQDYNIHNESGKFFNRLDWNISDKEKFSIRNNFVTSQATNLERSSQEFQFGSYDFAQHNVNSSTAAELKSIFNSTTFNNLILTYTTIHDYRDPIGDIFPQIQINNVSQDPNVTGPNHILLGTNREAGIFNMHQHTFELTDNLSKTIGKNFITLGTHNEFYNILYGFVNSWNGRFEYNSLADFFANKPSRMRAFYNLADNDRQYNLDNPSAKFNIDLLSGYLQDEYSLLKNLTITPGVRIDYTYVPHAPKTNPAIFDPDVISDPNYGTTYTYSQLSTLKNTMFGQVLVSPRVGINYDVFNDHKLILRGGSGMFTGRIPFAWLGYTYYNNGTDFASFDVKNPGMIYIPTDPTQFPAFNTAAKPYGLANTTTKTEVDLVSSNFKMPAVWRSSAAMDYTLQGYKFTVEYLYSQVINDVEIQQVNLKDSVRYASYDANHQQPIFLSGGANKQSVDPAYTAIYLLSNTSEGYRNSITFQVQKSYRFGLDFMVAYTLGHSKDILNGIRNSPESGWQTNPELNPNSPTLAYSNFDIRDRIVSNIMFHHDWNKKNTSFISLYFNAQSGSPYTFVNNAGSASLTSTGTQSELAYIPSAEGQIEFVPNNASDTRTADEIWQQFSAYVNSNSYLKSRIGEFTQRNGARTPWNVDADLRLMHDFNFGSSGDNRHQLEISFDIINFTNLLNPKWGWFYYTPNTINSSVSTGLVYVGHDATTGLEKYYFNTPSGTPYAVDQLASRWQGQLGVRYNF